MVKPTDDIPIVEPVEDVEPIAPKAPPSGRKFPCAQCGARLDFDPSQRALKCPYCGHVEEIAPAAEGVQERDYEAYFENIANKETTLAGRSSEVRCPGCGAIVLLEDTVVTDRCPYCATHLENKPEAAHGMIAPDSILPFKVTNRAAITSFNEWLAGRWFAPNDLKSMANLGKLNGVYVPYWTYDSMTFSRYSGQRGDNYVVMVPMTVMETYTTIGPDGRPTTHSRPVTKMVPQTQIRWTRVAGEVEHFFDDVMVCGSRSLPSDLLSGLGDWGLRDLEGFKPEFLSGMMTERYVVDVKEGFDVAKGVMKDVIHRLCCQDIGGDHQRLESVHTQHVGTTFKHLLAPIWLAAYRYHDKPFRILINARTGRVTGNRPYSWIKITLFVLAIIALVALLFGVVMVASQEPQGGHPRQPGPTRSLPAEKLPAEEFGRRELPTTWSAGERADARTSATALSNDRSLALFDAQLARTARA